MEDSRPYGVETGPGNQVCAGLGLSHGSESCLATVTRMPNTLANCETFVDAYGLWNMQQALQHRPQKRDSTTERMAALGTEWLRRRPPADVNSGTQPMPKIQIPADLFCSLALFLPEINAEDPAGPLLSHMRNVKHKTYTGHGHINNRAGPPPSVPHHQTPPQT